MAESDRRGAGEPTGERRRYYCLTALGQRALALELKRLDALIRPPAVRTIMRSWDT